MPKWGPPRGEGKLRGPEGEVGVTSHKMIISDARRGEGEGGGETHQHAIGSDACVAGQQGRTRGVQVRCTACKGNHTAAPFALQRDERAHLQGEPEGNQATKGRAVGGRKVHGDASAQSQQQGTLQELNAA
jgi:hypothetical protein